MLSRLGIRGNLKVVRLLFDRVRIAAIRKAAHQVRRNAVRLDHPLVAFHLRFFQVRRRRLLIGRNQRERLNLSRRVLAHRRRALRDDGGGRDEKGQG